MLFVQCRFQTVGKETHYLNRQGRSILEYKQWRHSELAQITFGFINGNKFENKTGIHC